MLLLIHIELYCFYQNSVYWFLFKDRFQYCVQTSIPNLSYVRWASSKSSHIGNLHPGTATPPNRTEIDWDDHKRLEYTRSDRHGVHKHRGIIVGWSETNWKAEPIVSGSVSKRSNRDVSFLSVYPWPNNQPPDKRRSLHGWELCSVQTQENCSYLQEATRS